MTSAFRIIEIFFTKGLYIDLALGLIAVVLASLLGLVYLGLDIYFTVNKDNCLPSGWTVVDIKDSFPLLEKATLYVKNTVYTIAFIVFLHIGLSILSLLVYGIVGIFSVIAKMNF